MLTQSIASISRASVTKTDEKFISLLEQKADYTIQLRKLDSVLWVPTVKPVMCDCLVRYQTSDRSGPGQGGLYWEDRFCGLLLQLDLKDVA